MEVVVKFVVFIILYGITSLITILVGFVCWKKHSKYPDMQVGYHTKKAMVNESVWNYGNKCAGILSIIQGIVLFIINPTILFIAEIDSILSLIVYFIEIGIYLLVILILPGRLIDMKYNINNK